MCLVILFGHFLGYSMPFILQLLVIIVLTSLAKEVQGYGRVLQSGGAIIFVLEKLPAMRPTTAKGLLTGVMDESS